MLTVQCVRVLISAPLASVLVNRFGCRPVVIAGSVIATFGFAICRLSESIDTLTITYGFIGGKHNLVIFPNIKRTLATPKRSRISIRRRRFWALQGT